MAVRKPKQETVVPEARHGVSIVSRTRLFSPYDKLSEDGYLMPGVRYDNIEVRPGSWLESQIQAQLIDIVEPV